MHGGRAGDGDLPGADIVAGTAVIGQVLGLLRDPVSQRVTRLITVTGRGAVARWQSRSSGSCAVARGVLFWA